MRTRASQWRVATPSTSCLCAYDLHYIRVRAHPAHAGGEEQSVPDASDRACPAVLSPPSFACPMPNALGGPSTAATKPFPSVLRRDTIPIAYRPPVCVQHAQAGRFSSTRFTRRARPPASWACSARGPPDKSLFVRRWCNFESGVLPFFESREECAWQSSLSPGT